MATDNSRPQCRAYVYTSNAFTSSRCARKAVVDGKWCHQHSPASVAARRKKADDRANAQWHKERYRIYGPTFYRVLEKISNGHNDPVALARKTIADFLAGRL